MVQRQHVEGFGDEVVYAGCIITILLATLVLQLWKNRHLFDGAIANISTTFNGMIIYFRGATGETDLSNSGEADNHVTNTTVYNNDNNCPICLNNCQYATLSNCGHIYCCQCIISYWRYGTWLSAIACPVCRTSVTLLMPQFMETDLQDVNRIQSLRDIRDYNRRFSDEPRPYMDYIRDIPVLVPNLFRQLFTLSGLMLMFRLRIFILLIAAALYIVSPLDVIPEAFLGIFGLLDDVFVGFLLLVYLCIAYRQFLRT